MGKSFSIRRILPGQRLGLIPASLLVSVLGACAALASVQTDSVPSPAPATVQETPVPSPAQTPTPLPGAAPVPVRQPGTPVVPILVRPFAGDYPEFNLLDHGHPGGSTANTGEQLSWWGAKARGLVGHLGYDWDLPEGTTVLAAGNGVVVRAGAAAPFWCDYLGRRVDDSLGVDIRHTAPNGEVFITSASHMSRVDVRVGDQVAAGQPVGLSGKTGCTNRAHLHFQTSRVARDGRRVVTDPYGWSGPGLDPRQAADPEAVSVWLWKEGQAPPLYRERRYPLDAGGSQLQITAWRWWGWSDDAHPFVGMLELRSAASGTALDIAGYMVSGPDWVPSYTLAQGPPLQEGQAVRLHLGAGTDTEGDRYWAAALGAGDGFCFTLRAPDGRFADRAC